MRSKLPRAADRAWLAQANEPASSTPVLGCAHPVGCAALQGRSGSSKAYWSFRNHPVPGRGAWPDRVGDTRLISRSQSADAWL